MEDTVKDFILLFVSIVYEAFPFVVLGALIAGFLEELVPQQFITRLIPRSAYLSIAISALLGIIFPMCECGIIPVMRRLLRKGLPLSCCVAYILAGPIINPVVIGSTYVAFESYKPEAMGSFWMVLLRCSMGYVIACVTATVVQQVFKKHGFALLAPLAVPPHIAAAAKREVAVETGITTPELARESATNHDDEDDEDVPGGKPRTLLERASNISETALHDFVDIMVFLVIGAMVAAFIRLALPAFKGLENPILAILFMMTMAVLMCLCSEADAFVAANFAVPPAAKLAFLALGPMLDLKLYLMYTRVFRPRLIWTIISCVLIQVFVYSVLMHFAWEQFVIPWMREHASGL